MLRERGVAWSQPWALLCTWSPNKLWRSNSIFNLCCLDIYSVSFLIGLFASFLFLLFLNSPVASLMLQFLSLFLTFLSVFNTFPFILGLISFLLRLFFILTRYIEYWFLSIEFFTGHFLYHLLVSIFFLLLNFLNIIASASLCLSIVTISTYAPWVPSTNCNCPAFLT